MLRVLDLPGVRRIEDRFRLNSATGSRQKDWELEEMVSSFITDTLQIDRDPHDIRWEADYLTYQQEDGQGDASAIRAANDHIPSKAAEWARRGWDVTDQDGRLLLCLGAIETALECVSRGLAGLTKMELEAAIWAQSKAIVERPASRASKSRDQAFLQLGKSMRTGSRR